MPALNGGTYGVLALSYLMTESVLDQRDLREVLPPGGRNAVWITQSQRVGTQISKNCHLPNVLCGGHKVYGGYDVSNLYRWPVPLEIYPSLWTQKLLNRETRNHQWIASWSYQCCHDPSVSEPPMEHNMKKIRVSKGLISNILANS